MDRKRYKGLKSSKYVKTQDIEKVTKTYYILCLQFSPTHYVEIFSIFLLTYNAKIPYTRVYKYTQQG